MLCYVCGIVFLIHKLTGNCNTAAGDHHAIAHAQEWPDMATQDGGKTRAAERVHLHNNHYAATQGSTNGYRGAILKANMQAMYSSPGNITTSLLSGQIPTFFFCEPARRLQLVVLGPEELLAATPIHPLLGFFSETLARSL